MVYMHSLDVYHIPFCWGLIPEKSTHFSFSITRIHAPEVSEKCTLSHALNPLNVKKKSRAACGKNSFGQLDISSYAVQLHHCYFPHAGIHSQNLLSRKPRLYTTCFAKHSWAPLVSTMATRNLEGLNAFEPKVWRLYAWQHLAKMGSCGLTLFQNSS